MASVSEEDVRSWLLPAELLSQTQTGGGGPGRVDEGYTEAGLGLTQHYYGTGWGCHLVGDRRGCDGHLLVPAVLLVTENASHSSSSCGRGWVVPPRRKLDARCWVSSPVSYSSWCSAAASTPAITSTFQSGKGGRPRADGGFLCREQGKAWASRESRPQHRPPRPPVSSRGQHVLSPGPRVAGPAARRSELPPDLGHGELFRC